MKQLLATTALLFLLAAPLQAAPSGISQVQILGDQIRVEVDVAGLFTATVTLTFESVVGLHPGSLEFDALQIDPQDPDLLSRLPDLVGIPALFPVLLDVSPSAQSGLSFTGVVDVDVSTESLTFDPAFRLFTAHAGGGFVDITNFSGMGSYRVRGTTGEFSEFLIVIEGRVNSAVVHSKFRGLQNSLNDHQARIEPGVFADLQALLDSAFSKYQTGLTSAAVEDMESFQQLVRENQGANIPDVYRANDPQTRNVAGILRSEAATLVFSLKLM